MARDGPAGPAIGVFFYSIFLMKEFSPRLPGCQVVFGDIGDSADWEGRVFQRV
jgi:hypothetical protein